MVQEQAVRDLVPDRVGDAVVVETRNPEMPAQMQQVLINLVKNAAESGSPAEEIAISVDEAPGAGAWRLRVLDRGSGMDDETMKRALLPFYSSKPTGSGLGLALCSEIVQAHGGTLRLERRAGGGIAVTCVLPSA